MKTIAFRTLGLLSLGLSLLSATTACEVACSEDEESRGGVCVAKSLTRYNGTPVSQSAAWSTGGSLTIDGVYGDITVAKGTADTVDVTFEPFSYRAHDAQDAAVREMNENLVLEITDGTNVTVKTGRNGGSNGLGAKITVLLPAAFDGAVTVTNQGNGPINPGDVKLDFVGTAPSVTLTNKELGNCKLQGSATVTTTNVSCDGEVTVLDVADNVTINATGLNTDAAVTLRLASVSDTATGGSITSEDGHILLTLPSTGNYSVQATSPKEGTVDFGTPPAACNVAEASAASKTLTCSAGGANYVVTAGTDSLGESSVVANYN